MNMIKEAAKAAANEIDRESEIHAIAEVLDHDTLTSIIEKHFSFGIGMFSKVEYVALLDILLKLAKFTKKLDPEGYGEAAWLISVGMLNHYPSLKNYSPGVALQHEQTEGQNCFLNCGYCIDELGDGCFHAKNK